MKYPLQIIINIITKAIYKLKLKISFYVSNKLLTDMIKELISV